MTDLAAPSGQLARAAKAPLGLVVLLGCLTGFGPIAIDMYLPALPAIARSLHASQAGGQQTVAAVFVGISAGQLFYGPLSDRWGRRPPLLFGIALYLVGTVGCAFSPNLAWLIAFRAAQGLGGCAGMVIARAVVRDTFAHDEVLHVFSMLMLVMGLGPILAPLLGAWVLLVADWRWIFGAQAIFGLVMGLATVLALKESRSAETAAQARQEDPIGAYAALLAKPELVGYLMTGAFSGAALFAYVACSPDILILFFKLPPQAFGWVFGLNAFGLIMATQFNARLARRYPSIVILTRANLLVFAVGAALLLCALTGFGGIFGILVPLFLIMAGLGFNQTNSAAGALNVDPLRAGATSALLGAGSFGTGALASAIAGALRDGSPRPMAWVIAMSLLIAVIALQLLVLKRRFTFARP